jgi:hypothetical protein
MAGHEELDTPLDIDLVTASLRSDASDTGVFLEALAAKLEAALPGSVAVQRRREGMFGPKRVARITIDAGDRRLALEAAGPALRATAAHVSGGITLKTEELDTDAWLNVLGRSLTEAARRSQSARVALERLLDL